MSWARFDDEYDDNPKCRAAGRDGRALDQCGIRYCAKYSTDGLIPDHDIPLLAVKAEVQAKRVVKKLVEVRRWHGPGHDCERCPQCPPGHYVVHDYLDYNPSAEMEREKRRKRAEAGRKGGRKSRPPGSKPEANASAVASTGAQADASASAQADAKHDTEQIGTPYPLTPTEEPTSSNGLTTRPDTPDDDPPAAPETPPDQDQRVGAALAILANRDLDARQAASHLEPIGDPLSWQNGAYDRRSGRHSEALRALTAEHPDATPEQLADLLKPPPQRSNGHSPEPPRTTPDGAPFMPGIGELTGPPHLPDPDPQITPDWNAMRDLVRQPHRPDPGDQP